MPYQSDNSELVIVDEILADAGGVMLGTEACVVLRNSGCTSKFIFSSANSSAEDVAKYEAAGGCATWPKPYPPIEDMANDIRATLQIHESLSRKVLLVEDDAMNISTYLTPIPVPGRDTHSSSVCPPYRSDIEARTAAVTGSQGAWLRGPHG